PPLALQGRGVAPVILSNLEPSNSNFVGTANFLNTIFDDRAALRIRQAPPPFRGAFSPEGYLDQTFAGNDPTGTWTLQIWDQGAPLPDFNGIGTLLDWSMTIQYGTV